MGWSLLARASWDLRTSSFRELRTFDGWLRAIAMAYEQEPGAAWDALRDRWLELPRHPNLLLALDHLGSSALLLRYAAIDWTREPSAQCEHAVSWGLQIADVFGSIAQSVESKSFGAFAAPFALIDIGDHARVGFSLVTPESPWLPPEVASGSPVDEQTLVYAAGAALRRTCVLDAIPEVRSVVHRCMDPDRKKRFRTLAALRKALRHIRDDDVFRDGVSLTAWELAEEACGCLAIGERARAAELFAEAYRVDPRSLVVQAGRAAYPVSTVSLSGEIHVKRMAIGQQRGGAKRTWSEVANEAAALEAARDFRGALALYLDVIRDANESLLYVAISRCSLALGDSGMAIDYAQRALAIDTRDVFALALRARGYLAQRKPEDALKAANAWVAAHPNDGEAHHARGRALFSLARFAEAREAFDRACVLAPEMAEALLMRREADRAMKRVRDEVGVQPPLELVLPEQLAHLREPLAAGRIDEAIADLANRTSDGAAQLALARCLAFVRRFDEALAALDRAAQHDDHQRAALLEKAHVLLALDRAGEALMLFERWPADREACEGRVLALRQLGREADADHQLASVLRSRSVV